MSLLILVIISSSNKALIVLYIGTYKIDNAIYRYICNCSILLYMLGRNPQQIKNEVAEKGDLGLVAETSRSTQKMMFAPPPLHVSGVFKKLKEIAKLTGNAVCSICITVHYLSL